MNTGESKVLALPECLSCNTYRNEFSTSSESKREGQEEENPSESLKLKRSCQKKLHRTLFKFRALENVSESQTESDKIDKIRRKTGRN